MGFGFRIGEFDFFSGKKSIINAEENGLEDDIYEKDNGGIDFGKNARHQITTPYENRSADRARLVESAVKDGVDITLCDCHHAGDEVLQLVEEKIHHAISHKLFSKKKK